MVSEGRPREEDRPFRIEGLWIYRWNGATRRAEERHQSAGAQAIETLVEGRFADRIVDDVHATAAGQPFYFLLEVLFGVPDHFVGAVLARELRLGLGGNRPEHASPERPRHLDDQ